MGSEKDLILFKTSYHSRQNTEEDIQYLIATTQWIEDFRP